MTDIDQAPLSVEDARLLVELLEKGDNAGATALLEAANLRDSMELFSEVGKLTRQLHDSLTSFQLDTKLMDLANESIPDAQNRLSYVIETTEKAANQTMDAVDASMPIVDSLNERITEIMPEWKKLMTRQLALGEFKSLCHDLDNLLEQSAEQSQKLSGLMTEVLMAQGFQDLTGQVIRRVIELVQEVEESLVNLLKIFGAPETELIIEEKAQEKQKEDDTAKAEGPIIDAENRDDVVSGQDEVDDLLSSLGF